MPAVAVATGDGKMRIERAQSLKANAAAATAAAAFYSRKPRCRENPS
jgi:hypothetical protein